MLRAEDAKEEGKAYSREALEYFRGYVKLEQRQMPLFYNSLYTMGTSTSGKRRAHTPIQLVDFVGDAINWSRTREAS